jgi:hypothetical protein
VYIEFVVGDVLEEQEQTPRNESQHENWYRVRQIRKYLAEDVETVGGLTVVQDL